VDCGQAGPGPERIRRRPARQGCSGQERSAGEARQQIAVAQIIKPHGLQGEVAVELHTDFPEHMVSVGSVVVSDARHDRTRRLRVQSVRPTVGTRALVKFEGVDDVDQARELRGGTVLLHKEDVPPPPEGAYYDFQIVGLQVITTGGKDLGRVVEIIRTGANDVFATERVLIPAVDHVVKSIDLERGEMLIEELEGLLD